MQVVLIHNDNEVERFEIVARYLAAQVGQFVSPLYTDLFVDNSADGSGRMRFIVCAVTSVIIGLLVAAFAYTLPKKPLENDA